MTGGENWVRFATNPAAYVLPLQISFHQTVLAKIDCILYDEMREITPAPRARRVDSTPNLWFFALCADTFEFCLLEFLTKKGRDELLNDGLSGGRSAKPAPVVLFRSGSEEESFVGELNRNPVDPMSTKEDEKDVCSNDYPMVTEDDKNIIGFSRSVIRRLREWRVTDSNAAE